MEGKKKVIILDGDKWNKQDFEEKIKILKNEISERQKFSKDEEYVLLKAIHKIDNNETENCDAVRNFEGTKELIENLMKDNIDIIISRDAKTFNRIGNEKNLPILIASKCSVYSLDGKINTILPIKKYEAIMSYLLQGDNIEKNQKSNSKSNKSDFSKCEICKKKMLMVDGCSVDTISIDGKTYERIKVGDVYDFVEGIEDKEFRCHDCNAQNGHFHHWGCDEERCPSCKKQLISCECKDVYIDSFENKFEASKYEKNREKIKSLENQINIINDKIKEYEKEETEDKIAIYLRKNSRTK